MGNANVEREVRRLGIGSRVEQRRDASRPTRNSVPDPLRAKTAWLSVELALAIELRAEV